MRGIKLVVLFTLVLAGCHKNEIASGPHFNLDNLPEQSVAAPTTVIITDARPEWERRAFKGMISLVPMEDLAPSPLERLQWGIERQARQLADPPSKVSLELQSFRVVISTEDSFLHHERNYGLPADPGALSSGGGWGAAAMVVFCVAVVGAVELGIYTYDMATEFVHDQRHLHSRPKELTDDYAKGVTCDVRLKLVSEWRDGRHAEVQLREVVNHIEQEFEYAPPYTTHDAVRDSVRGVCEQLARDWREKLLNPASEVGTGKPKPQFTSYSGN